MKAQFKVTKIANHGSGYAIQLKPTEGQKDIPQASLIDLLFVSEKVREKLRFGKTYTVTFKEAE